MTNPASKSCPVDFDHHGAAHAADWPGDFARMREQCPRAWSEQHGGFWVGRFDIVEDLTNPLPALVTMDLFGFPLDEWRDFTDPFHKVVYTPRDDPNYMDTVRGLDHFNVRVAEEVAKRRKEPKDDLLGYFASGDQWRAARGRVHPESRLQHPRRRSRHHHLADLERVAPSVAPSGGSGAADRRA